MIGPIAYSNEANIEIPKSTNVYIHLISNEPLPNCTICQ